MLYLGEPQEHLPRCKEVRRGRVMELDDGWRLAFRSFKEKAFGRNRGLAEAYEEKSGKAGASAGAASGGCTISQQRKAWRNLREQSDMKRTLCGIRIAMGKCFRLILELSMKRWRIWLNGEKKAVRIVPPYSCSITGVVKGQKPADSICHQYARTQIP